jgi:hypothetical protein
MIGANDISFWVCDAFPIGKGVQGNLWCKSLLPGYIFA